LYRRSAGVQRQRKGKGRGHTSRHSSQRNSLPPPHLTQPLLTAGAVVCRPWVSVTQPTDRTHAAKPCCRRQHSVYVSARRVRGLHTPKISSPEQAATTALLWQLPAGAGAAPCMPHAATTTPPPSTNKITACSHRLHVVSPCDDRQHHAPRHPKRPPAMHNNQPCTSSPQAQPPSQHPSNIPHLKHDLYYSSTERRMQHPAQNLQRQTRERAPNTRDDPALSCWHTTSAVESSKPAHSGKRPRRRDLSTHNTLSPKRARTTSCYTSAVFSWLTRRLTRPRPSVPPPSFTRWAAALAWLCTACQPLFRAMKTRHYIRQKPNCSAPWFVAQRPSVSLSGGRSRRQSAGMVQHNQPVLSCTPLCCVVQYSKRCAVLCWGRWRQAIQLTHATAHPHTQRSAPVLPEPTHPPTHTSHSCLHAVRAGVHVMLSAADSTLKGDRKHCTDSRPSHTPDRVAAESSSAPQDTLSSCSCTRQGSHTQVHRHPSVVHTVPRHKAPSLTHTDPQGA
jgi:hypothetical protein